MRTYHKWRTPDNKSVWLDYSSDDPYTARVWIEGKEVDILNVSLRRDGGTRCYTLDYQGRNVELVLFRRMLEEPYEVLDNVVLIPIK